MKLFIFSKLTDCGESYIAQVDFNKYDGGDIGTPASVKYSTTKEGSLHRLKESLESKGHEVITGNQIKTPEEMFDMHPQYNWICQDNDGTIHLFKSNCKPVVWGSTFLSKMWCSYWGYGSTHEGNEITTDFPIIELKDVDIKWPQDCRTNGLKIVENKDNK